MYDMQKKRSDGRLQKTITITKNGQKIRKYFYGKTIAEINQKIINYHEKEEIGRTFNEVAEEWKEEHFNTIEVSTAHSYIASFKRGIDHFGTNPIKSISIQDINKFITDFAKLGMAHKTVSNQKLVLSLIFHYAILKGDIKYNPVPDIVLPKNLNKSRRKLPTASEIEIVKKSYNKTFGLFFYFLLFSGLRRGEALALTYEDINFNNNVIYVTKHISERQKSETFKRLNSFVNDNFLTPSNQIN